MIRFEKTEVTGWEAAIRGMRNPMNSWEKSDTIIDGERGGVTHVWIGVDDKKLMRKLSSAGPAHRKFMRMVAVYVDVTAPFYWWKEYDTYKVGTVANSCSTMHKLAGRPFTLDDFSHEFMDERALESLRSTISVLEELRTQYNSGLLKEDEKTEMWQSMVRLLPSCYNQRRTLMLNYEVLTNIYHSRKNHKLYEWREFCRWAESLPHSDLITGKESNR